MKNQDLKGEFEKSWPKFDVAKNLPLGCGVLFPKDLGNYARNSLNIGQIFLKLREATPKIKFLAYHPRRSGNFLFWPGAKQEELLKAKQVGEKITQLPCITRSIAALLLVNNHLPPAIQSTSRGSLYLATEKGAKKIILVMLSDSVEKGYQSTGPISPKVDIYKWVSPSDVLLLYARPQAGGDVGQVTTALLKHLKKSCADLSLLDGTGRAMSVIKDLVVGNNIRYA